MKNVNNPEAVNAALAQALPLIAKIDTMTEDEIDYWYSDEIRSLYQWKRELDECLELLANPEAVNPELKDFWIRNNNWDLELAAKNISHFAKIISKGL